MTKRQDERLRDWPLREPAVCGVGSLPFASRRDAHAFVRSRCAIAPFVAELPRARGGAFMIDAALEPPAIDDVERGIRSVVSRSSRLVKLQTCGPITLAANGLDAREAERITLRNLDARLGADARGRARLVVLDEPSLAGRRSAPSLARCLDRIREAGAYAGIHVCGEFSGELIARLDPDLLSFDAWNALDAVMSAPAIRRWYARGRVVALGLVPTKPAKIAIGSLARSAASALVAAGHVAGESPPPLLTGNCGFALSTEAWTTRAFATLDRLTAALEQELSRCSSTARTSR